MTSPYAYDVALDALDRDRVVVCFAMTGQDGTPEVHTHSWKHEGAMLPYTTHPCDGVRAAFLASLLHGVRIGMHL